MDTNNTIETSEKTATIHLVINNPNPRPAMFRSRLGRMRDFTAKFKLLKNEN